MANELERSIKDTIGEQALRSPVWTMPYLRHLYDAGARDMKNRTQEELQALCNDHLSGTYLRQLVESATADGLLESDEARRGRTYRFSEMSRLIFLNTEDAADKAIPLFKDRHREKYGLNYDMQWDQHSREVLESKYSTNGVAEWKLRAAAFDEAREIYKAASLGDNALFRKLLTVKAWQPPQEKKKDAKRPNPEGDAIPATPKVEGSPEPSLVQQHPVVIVQRPAPAPMRVSCVHCHGTGTIIVSATPLE